ncbi:MAG: bifunctional riboflavin kinase/FAD synthetase [Chthoniobacterales bacterium]
MNPRVIQNIPDLSAIAGKVVFAVGVFDGVHLGHQALIKRALDDAARLNAQMVVLTFDPHPLKILRPDAAPRLLTATEHKLHLIASEGVDTVLLLRFDKEFAAQSPDIFIRSLTESCDVAEICVGHEWAFGKNRAGNVTMLQTLGTQHDFEVVSIPPVLVDGETVSSTRVRKAIEGGDFEMARRCLGRDFTILGTVKHGKHLGRELGFPTANLSGHNEQFPPNGVYAVEANVSEKWLPGVANIGFRPTVELNLPERTLEVHLFDFSEDIYGRDMELRFVSYLRAEQKFDGLDALKAQIHKDVQDAKKTLSL